MIGATVSYVRPKGNMDFDYLIRHVRKETNFIYA